MGGAPGASEGGHRGSGDTRWQWLKGPSRTPDAEKLALARLRADTRWAARAWELKAPANLWNYRRRTWASGCALEPVPKAARMMREHIWGILNAIILRATNGPTEGINSRIKTVKGPRPWLSQP
ncbi:MAG: transposase [bacterium]|nr:transposase [bacterium]